jgi:hypothetical protein
VEHFSYEGAYRTLPATFRVPKDVPEGVRCAVYFGAPDNGWYEGKIKQVNKRKTQSENITCEFADGNANIYATIDNYGPDKLWVILDDAHNTQVINIS